MSSLYQGTPADYHDFLIGRLLSRADEASKFDEILEYIKLSHSTEQLESKILELEFPLSQAW